MVHAVYRVPVIPDRVKKLDGLPGDDGSCSFQDTFHTRQG
jgi:hypothetical protein